MSVIITSSSVFKNDVPTCHLLPGGVPFATMTPKLFFIEGDCGIS